MGGVSAGTFNPLFTLQKHDRLAAVSISGPSWSQFEYYWGTQSFRKAMGARGDWQPKPVGEGLEFWRQLDLADNVETIEAPILINAPASEMFGLIRLINHMAEAGKPYDAYVFPKETHLKWQPAHLQAIMQRNLDWFRFWLQFYEDPDAAKVEQYSRWRKLRELRKSGRAHTGKAAPSVRF
jgi:dipeptidyl aminopeptidase/acylaminoacyl peptidase